MCPIVYGRESHQRREKQDSYVCSVQKSVRGKRESRSFGARG